MAIFRITETNLRFFKSLLMSDFEMRSGHCDEAIAALCGFKTYASMRHAIKSREIRSTIEVTFEGFESRCSALSYDQNSSEYLKLIFHSVPWPDASWISYKSQDTFHSDDWYYRCENVEFPFIRIQERRKYRTLEWDCITLTSDSDHHTQGEAGNELVRQMHSTFQLICRGVEQKSYFDGSAFCGEITGLSQYSARQLANLYTAKLAPLATMALLEN